MRQVLCDDGATLTIAGTPPRLGGEAAVYDATGPHGPCVVKVAWRPLPDGAWLHQERALLASLAEDPATASLVPRVLHGGLWDDRPFVALERFPSTLADVIAARPPVEERLRLAARVADVAGRLRRARPSLVHRDLKPSNVLVDGDRVVLTDLGIARDVGLGATTTTALLTPDYAAPEQALPRRRPDPSWDTFGLAATIVHLVTGEPSAAPAANAWRLTERGRRLRTGDDDGSGEAWDYLDLRAPALTSEDRARLDRVVRGPLRRAIEAAMAPDPRRRSGTPETLREALLATSPARARKVPWLAPLAVPAVAVAVALGAAWVTRPATLPDYPMVRVEGGRAEGARGPEDVPAFLLGAVEVDQALWTSVTGTALATRRIVEDGALGASCETFHDLTVVGDTLPMVCVDFLDAVAFANEMSRRQGLTPALRVDVDDGRYDVVRIDGADGYRLPTIAELRLAAGDVDHGPLENRADHALQRALPSFDVDDTEDGWALAAPVGSFPPAPSGAHDLYGNVAEWAWDEDEATGKRWTSWSSWNSTLSAEYPWGYAQPFDAAYRQVTLGIRLARDVE